MTIKCNRCKVVRDNSMYSFKRENELYKSCNVCRKVYIEEYRNYDKVSMVLLNKNNKYMTEKLRELHREVVSLRQGMSELNRLDKKGHVYLDYRPDHMYSIRELLDMNNIDVSNLYDITLSSMMTEEEFEIKKDRKTFILHMGRHIAIEYKKCEKKRPERSRTLKTAGEIVAGKSGLRCLYPERYSKNIEEYIEIHKDAFKRLNRLYHS